MLSVDIKIFVQLKRSDEQAFKGLFESYYIQLLHFALNFINKKEPAEEIVRDVFITLWDNRHELEIQSSFKSYLFEAVKNRCLSYLRQLFNNVETIAEDNFKSLKLFKIPDLSQEITRPESLIPNAISSLSDQSRIIFNLSRNSGLTYREIAKGLNISSETVKTQISIALKKIKLYLEIYWELVYN